MPFCILSLNGRLDESFRFQMPRRLLYVTRRLPWDMAYGCLLNSLSITVPLFLRVNFVKASDIFLASFIMYDVISSGGQSPFL